jgi:DNA-binding NarL/FixJ family response regulator
MRIVIAEDAAVIRAGLREILTDRGHEIVAAVGDAAALLAAVAAHEPDVAIVDVRMPPDHTDEGLRAAITIRRTHPAVGILVFSQYIETRYAADLLSRGSGGVGYLLKDRVANVAEFADAIDRVAAGGTALDPEVVTGLLNATRHGAALDALTPREHDVLTLMAEGRSNGAIAGRFFVSERAVEKHISNIFSKLGLPPSDSDHRRVLAVLAFLNDRLPPHRPWSRYRRTAPGRVAAARPFVVPCCRLSPLVGACRALSHLVAAGLGPRRARPRSAARRGSGGFPGSLGRFPRHRCGRWRPRCRSGRLRWCRQKARARASGAAPAPRGSGGAGSESWAS